MGSLRNDRRHRRLSLAVGVSLALAAGSVLADAPKASSAPQPGILTFPNVKVINAPASTVASDNAAKKAANSAQSQQGLRAFVNPSNGQLREPTSEEAVEVADAGKAKSSARSVGARSRSAAVSTEATSTETIYGPANAIGMEVGAEFEVYQVVHKTPKGLKAGEFQSKAAADKAVLTETNSAQSEVSHDR